jgi:hypothetical protein
MLCAAHTQKFFELHDKTQTPADVSSRGFQYLERDGSVMLYKEAPVRLTSWTKVVCFWQVSVARNCPRADRVQALLSASSSL